MQFIRVFPHLGIICGASTHGFVDSRGRVSCLLVQKWRLRMWTACCSMTRKWGYGRFFVPTFRSITGTRSSFPSVQTFTLEKLDSLINVNWGGKSTMPSNRPSESRMYHPRSSVLRLPSSHTPSNSCSRRTLDIGVSHEKGRGR